MPVVFNEAVWSEVKVYDPLGIRDGDIVMDVGANIGAFTVRALARGARKVYCIEPDAENFNALQERFAISKRVELFHAAVAATTGTQTLYEGNTNTTHSTVPYRGRENSVEVPAYSLQDLMRAIYPTVVKVDIEGAEYDLDFTMSDGVRAVGVELHWGRRQWREVDGPAILASLEAQGFKVVATHGVTPNARTSVYIWHRQLPQ